MKEKQQPQHAPGAEIGSKSTVSGRRQHLSKQELNRWAVIFEAEVEGSEEDRTFWEEETIQARLEDGAGGREERRRGKHRHIATAGSWGLESQAEDSGVCWGVSGAPGRCTRRLDGKEVRMHAGRPGCRNGPTKHGLGSGDRRPTPGQGAQHTGQALSGSLAGGPSLEAPGGSPPPR